MNALEVNDLRKTYGNGVEALKGISLSVEEGDFFALLGPNGAGKSTLIGIISSLVNASSGETRVFGASVQQQRSLAMSYIGLVPQELNLNQFEKPLEIVVNQAGYYGIPLPVCARVMFEALKDHLDGETGIQEVVIALYDAPQFNAFQTAMAALS